LRHPAAGLQANVLFALPERDVVKSLGLKQQAGISREGSFNETYCLLSVINL
jgi:hypothetical protein